MIVRREYYLNQEKKHKSLSHKRNEWILSVLELAWEAPCVKQTKKCAYLWQDFLQYFWVKWRLYWKFKVKIIRKLSFKVASVKKNLDLSKRMQRTDRQMERIGDVWERGTTESYS